MSLVSITLLFFLSGACSLVYETLWIRVLSLGVGSTSAAMSIVLAIFFLGLSVGSWLSGRLQKNASSALKSYALLEAGIGLYGLLAIYPLTHFHQILSLLPFVGTLGWLGHLGKFALCALLLTPPTLAMGATLPLLVTFFESTRATQKSTQAVSLLYAINTLGAAAGTVAASFWLLPTFGITHSNQIAAGANLLIACACFALARKTFPVPLQKPTTRPLFLKIEARDKALLGLAFVRGFASLAGEIVWNRYLGIFLGNNLYGLGLVLSLYLLGIAVGALVLNRIVETLRRPERLFYVLLLIAAIGTALTAFCFKFLPVITLSTGYALGLGSSLLLLKCLFVCALLLPVTIAFGALFPLTIHLMNRTPEESARALSWVYSVNTVGAILGSYLAGIWLVPLIGSSWTLRIAAVLLAGAAGYFAWHTLTARRAALALASFVALLVVSLPKTDFSNIIKSAYLQRVEPGNIAQAMKYFDDQYEKFVWVGEGETSIISLSHDPKDGDNYQDYLRLKTNGLNESVYQQKNLQELPRYEALLGLLPFLFSDSPRNAFVVGYGGGYTVDLLTSLPIEKVIVVELEKAILQAASVVHHGKNPLLERPSLALSIEDARFVLATKMHGPLDIIVSQPSHSWLAGAANLFTRDFFQIVSGNLSEKGVFAQWLNLYNMDDTTLASILRTFYTVFPDGAVFSGENDQEMILIGSKSPLRFNLSASRRIESNPALMAKLTDVPFDGPANIFAHFALSRNQVLEVTGGAPSNSDDNAFAESRQSRLFYRGVSQDSMPQGYLTKHYDADFLGSLPDGEWHYEILAAMQKGGQHQKFFRLLGYYEIRAKNDPENWSKLGYLCLKAQRFESALSYLKRAFERKPETNVLNLLLAAMSETKRIQEASQLLSRNRQLADAITDCYALSTYLALGAKVETDRVANRLIADIPGYTEACGDYFNRIVGDYYFERKQFEIAIPFYEAYYKAFSQDVDVLRKMAVAYLGQNDWGNAKSFSNYLPSVVAGEKKQIEGLVKFYEKQRLFDDAKALQAKAEQLEPESVSN